MKWILTVLVSAATAFLVVCYLEGVDAVSLFREILSSF